MLVKNAFVSASSLQAVKANVSCRPNPEVKTPAYVKRLPRRLNKTTDKIAPKPAIAQ